MFNDKLGGMNQETRPDDRERTGNSAPKILSEIRVRGVQRFRHCAGILALVLASSLPLAGCDFSAVVASSFNLPQETGSLLTPVVEETEQDREEQRVKEMLREAEIRDILGILFLPTKTIGFQVAPQYRDQFRLYHQPCSDCFLNRAEASQVEELAKKQSLGLGIILPKDGWAMVLRGINRNRKWLLLDPREGVVKYHLEGSDKVQVEIPGWQAILLEEHLLEPPQPARLVYETVDPAAVDLRLRSPFSDWRQPAQVLFR